MCPSRFFPTTSNHKTLKSLNFFLGQPLRNVETWRENIRLHNIPEALTKFIGENTTLASELSDRERAIKKLCAEQRLARANPLRWAVAILWQRYCWPILLGLVVLVSLLLRVWLRASTV